MFETIALLTTLAALAGLSAIAVRLGKTAPDTAAWRISGRVNQVGRWMLGLGTGVMLVGIPLGQIGSLAVLAVGLLMAFGSAILIIAAFIWRVGLRYGVPAPVAAHLTRTNIGKARRLILQGAAVALAFFVVMVGRMALGAGLSALERGDDNDDEYFPGGIYNYAKGKNDNGMDPWGLYDDSQL